MSSNISNWLIDISNSLEYANDELHTAETAAQEIDFACDGEWGELSSLLQRITDLRADLTGAVTPAMRASMDAARREIDELADMADAASY